MKITQVVFVMDNTIRTDVAFPCSFNEKAPDECELVIDLTRSQQETLLEAIVSHWKRDFIWSNKAEEVSNGNSED